MHIDDFSPADQEPFARLNRAWLVDHGIHEAADERQLTDPVGTILEPGGRIFVAREGSRVVGTCAMVPHGPGVYEIAKLVVAPEARGRGLGRQLVETGLAFARDQGAARVMLLSSSLLVAALALYERVGFRRLPLPADNPYATADVYMELDLFIDS